MEDVKAGRRYAAALFLSCVAENVVEEVYGDLRLVVELLEGSEAFERYLRSPVLTAERKKAVLDELLGGRLSERGLTFLKFLVDKKRTAALQAVFARYEELWNAQKGLLRAKVTTATALQPEQREALVAKLHMLTGRKVELAEEVDASILGGAIVTYGDRMIDGSLRRQLSLVRERMKEVRVI